MTVTYFKFYVMNYALLVSVMLAILLSYICDWSILMTYQVYDFWSFLIGNFNDKLKKICSTSALPPSVRYPIHSHAGLHPTVYTAFA